MKAKLKVVEGAKQCIVRLKLPTVIGRSKDASIKVPQSQVSRQHCEIYEEDKLLVVEDLGSSNGTFIDGERVQEPTFLYPGETLRIGNIVFQAIYDAPRGVGDEVDPDGTEIIQADQATFDSSPPPQSVTSADDPKKVMDTSSASEESRDVLEDPDAEVEYKENDHGSFLGIRDIETDEAHSVDASDSASDFQIDSEKTEPDVDPGDSALNKFFKNLE